MIFVCEKFIVVWHRQTSVIDKQVYIKLGFTSVFEESVVDQIYQIILSIISLSHCYVMFANCINSVHVKTKYLLVNTVKTIMLSFKITIQ